LQYDLRLTAQKLQTQTERADRYFKRLRELKAKISDLDLLLKFDNYTEDEAYEIPMPELRQLANDQLSGQLKKYQLMRS
jgi:7,8-dihydro-6-hydroxymethylpterin-pyrophosphokinase